MEYREVVNTRRMVRAFRPHAVDDDQLDRILGAACRAPSAGHTQALDLVVLATPEQVAAYWDTTLPPDRLDGFPWPGLLSAPVLVLVVTRPDAYAERYAEADKVATGLGRGIDAWPVPYWFVDAGGAIMAMLHAAVDEHLGALLFGVFEHEAAVADRFSVPGDRRIVATVAIGHPAPDRPSRSAGRGRRPKEEVVHRGRW